MRRSDPVPPPLGRRQAPPSQLLRPWPQRIRLRVSAVPWSISMDSPCQKGLPAPALTPVSSCSQNGKLAKFRSCGATRNTAPRTKKFSEEKRGGPPRWASPTRYDLARRAAVERRRRPHPGRPWARQRTGHQALESVLDHAVRSGHRRDLDLGVTLPLGVLHRVFSGLTSSPPGKAIGVVSLNNCH